MAAKKKLGTNSRGGRRKGAGRPTSEVKNLREQIIAESDRMICDQLPKLIANMLYLANGGYEQVEHKFVPNPTAEENRIFGEPEMILQERKVSIAAPDRGANQYLIDRILGKPKQAVLVTGMTAKEYETINSPDNL